MKMGKTLTELAVELDRQRNSKRDFIVDTRNVRFNLDGGQQVLDLVNQADGHTHVERFALNGIAHRQIQSHLKIPADYYDRMLDRQPDLLTQNVNTWLMNEPAKRMVRTLDGTARAYLSDRYRRIDNFDIASTALPVISEIKEARVESCELTEKRMYLKVVNPRLEAEVRKGDIVQAGILISNSEVGHGAISIQPLVFRLVCLNGMVVNDLGQRKYHVGRANDDSSYELYQDETLQADDQAFMLKVRDTVRAAVDEAKFAHVVNKMKESTEVEMTGPVQQVVELAAGRYSLNKTESEGVLQHLIKGGDLSLYGLSNAVTRTAQDAESYDRSTEMESLGWNLLNMSRQDWEELNRRK